ncbi:putative invertase inhibitor [Vitis vinifera]|uniref:Putative invertase inhibitor n=1 Tax=Vitis vinifera TaxID=29760 RepID=A0A438IU10_VITVI|nr:putative invertase inhibitor [Vitis vinifera]
MAFISPNPCMYFSSSPFHSSLSCQLIHQTCTRIADNDPNVSYNLCVMSLESNPMSASASLEELGVIAVELALSNATYINWYISNKLLQEKGFDPYAEACLKDCHELYSDAIPELKDVLDDFKDKDYYKANIELSAAMERRLLVKMVTRKGKVKVSLGKRGQHLLSILHLWSPLN